VRFRVALASSLNIAAVGVLERHGVTGLLDLLRGAGVRSLDRDAAHYGLGLTLGSGEVRPFELATAYAGLARGGVALVPRFVLEARDAEGRALALAGAPAPGRFVDARVAWLVTDMLADAEARVLGFPRRGALDAGPGVAVKTGTSQSFRDAWTVGYTPEVTVAVWAGDPDGRPMRRVTGARGAGPIWRALVEAAHARRGGGTFARPAGIEEARVCALSGARPGPDCPGTQRELFVAGSAPVHVCTFHRRAGDDVRVALPPPWDGWARERGYDVAPPSREGPPRVTLRAPAAGALYRLDPDLPPDQQMLTAAADVAGAVDRVRFLVDGALVAEAGPPFRVPVPLRRGALTIAVEAADDPALRDAACVSVR
jgi:penicillin-binding protein 1C